MRERRDWQIMTRGRIPLAHDVEKTDQIIGTSPERQRISKQIPLKGQLSRRDMIEAIRDLYSPGARSNIVYYPGEEPNSGNCQFCGESIQKVCGA